jgi:hypothetical protein
VLALLTLLVAFYRFLFFYLKSASVSVSFFKYIFFATEQLLQVELNDLPFHLFNSNTLKCFQFLFESEFQIASSSPLTMFKNTSASKTSTKTVSNSIDNVMMLHF